MQQKSLKARCDFAYGSFLVLSLAFIPINIWLNQRMPDDIKGNDVFLIPLALLFGYASLVLLPALGVVAGVVAYPHPPALFLGCLSFFGFLTGIRGEQAVAQVIVVLAVPTSIWWFARGRKKLT